MAMETFYKFLGTVALEKRKKNEKRRKKVKSLGYGWIKERGKVVKWVENNEAVRQKREQRKEE